MFQVEKIIILNIYYICFIFLKGIAERDHDLKKTREESIHIQRQLEEQLAVETSANQDLQVVLLLLID